MQLFPGHRRFRAETLTLQHAVCVGAQTRGLAQMSDVDGHDTGRVTRAEEGIVRVCEMNTLRESGNRSQITFTGRWAGTRLSSLFTCCTTALALSRADGEAPEPLSYGL